MKIMIVDDNPKMRDLIQSMLGGFAHERCEAKDGLEAVLKYSDELPDVVLMDIRMPVMSGIEATVTIRANESATTGRIPIIALTANAFAEDREACLAAGMNEYVAKPVDKTKLLDTIEKMTAKV